MRKILSPESALRGLLITIAAMAPAAFPASQMGHSTLHDLALSVIVPAAVSLAVAWALLARSRFDAVAAALRNGAIAGQSP